MRKPCSNCPWRRDAPPGYWDPDHFRSIWVNCQDDGTHLMLCHKSGARPPAAPQIVCQGWIRVMKQDAIGVRLALVRDLVTIEEVEDTDGPDLFTTFRAMLVANGIRPPARNRYMPKHRRSR
jgi:hypothetical protein